MKKYVVASLLLIVALVVAACGTAIPASQVEEVADVAISPTVELVGPAAASLVGRDAVVQLRFNIAMDTASLAAASSFQPAVPFDVKVRDDGLTEFVPQYLLARGAVYSFSLQAGAARSEDEQVLDAGVSVAFSTRDDGLTLTVPRLGYVDPVIERATADEVTAALGNGVGRFPDTGRTGGGNVVLFAHVSGRINFPYNRIFELQPGDTMILTYGGKDWVYAMDKGFVVHQTEMWILDPTPEAMITLFVCSTAEGAPSPTFHPPYRYVVRALLSQAP
jgi:sortase (surface protein transpeptidase)